MRAEPEAGVAVLVHELTHALGFTDDMFDKFIDDSGQPLPKSQVSLGGGDACVRGRGVLPSRGGAWHAFVLSIALLNPRQSHSHNNCPYCKRTVSIAIDTNFPHRPA